jgi:hypothetical protein
MNQREWACSMQVEGFHGQWPNLRPPAHDIWWNNRLSFDHRLLVTLVKSDFFTRGKKIQV